MENEILVIDGVKLLAARGTRSRGAIVRAAKKAFSTTQLLAWERGLYRPRPEVLPTLLNALGVEYNTVVSPLKVKRKSRKLNGTKR